MGDFPGPVFGAVADDLTGAVDLATGLAEAGLRTRISTHVDDLETGGADAVVMALKSRTIPPEKAVELSVTAARALLAGGVKTLFFKYCSTFDSTPEGNIGPVADALLDLVGSPLAVVAPGYPVHGRTVYQGHLFVGPDLLSRSSMRHHPLTPMTESDVALLLGAQSSHPVGKVALAHVRADRMRERFEELAGTGVRYAVVDTVEDHDLDVLARACRDHPLITGGAGLAHALGRQLGVGHRLGAWTAPQGRVGVITGSCSQATLRQVAAFAEQGGTVHRVDPRESSDASATVDRAVRWALAQDGDQPFVISSTMEPAQLREVHAELGRDVAAQLVERVMGEVALALVEAGVSGLLVAGGETAGAVAAALGVRSLRVTLPISPGLAWCETDSGIALALKSGNFGSDTVFRDAHALLGAAV